MEKIALIGLGYIGLPTALVAARHGLSVIGYDIDSYRVKCINAGNAFIQEPDITEILQDVLQNNQFYATTKLEPADCFIIAVPTPFKEKNEHNIVQKQADLSYVWNAASALAPVLQKGNTVILESTVPVGTTQKLASFLEHATGLKAGIDFYCVHCPERVLPGRIFYELVHNPRIIGGINLESVHQAKLFYKKFVKAELYLTTAATAEMVKLIENSSRDVALAFAHQVADIAQAAGLNPYEVIELANKHPRVNILHPRCGVGGHCIAVDPWFLIETFHAQTHLLQTARRINDHKPLSIVHSIQKICLTKQTKQPCKTLILGVTYKPNVDDIRESPALFITQQLLKDPAFQVRVCEPHCIPSALASKGIYEAMSLIEGLAWADMVIALVDHAFFKNQCDQIATHPHILDFCGLLYQPRIKEDTQEHLLWSGDQDSAIHYDQL
ncbi:MAG: nucleotide sugar dehydrogenase [Candidatus Babeliaceae bacterium]